MAPSIPTDPSEKESPSVKSLKDLRIIQSWEPETNKFMYVNFYHVTRDEEIYFGESPKNPREITLDEYRSSLKHIKDDEIYPKVPEDITLTIAPDSLDEVSVFIKRPGLMRYEYKRGTDRIPKEVLDETLIMEQVSKLQHPNIVEYYGCRVRRGRVTGIVMERLDWTLHQYVKLSASASQQLDRVKFVEALESAVNVLHSLGLAHNDINPYNIMVKNGMPVLIDFGSCRPFGKQLLSHGTPGCPGLKRCFTHQRRNMTHLLWRNYDSGFRSRSEERTMKRREGDPFMSIIPRPGPCGAIRTGALY